MHLGYLLTQNDTNSQSFAYVSFSNYSLMQTVDLHGTVETRCQVLWVIGEVWLAC